MNKLLISTAIVLSMGIATAASAADTGAATTTLRNNQACTPGAAKADGSADSWFKKLDADANGEVSMREYELQCMAANSGSGAEGDEYSRQQARKNFGFLDSNGDQKIDSGEYTAAAGNSQIKWDTAAANKDDAKAANHDDTARKDSSKINKDASMASKDGAKAGMMDPAFGKMRIGEVVGKQVVDENGKPVGTIQAVVVDPKGAQKYSVVSVQRYMDLGDKVVALPVNNFVVRNDKIMLMDTSNKLKQAPKYDEKSFKKGDQNDVIDSKEERLQQ